MSDNKPAPTGSTRSTADIIDFLGDTDPSAVIRALVSTIGSPKHGRGGHNALGRRIGTRDAIISDAIRSDGNASRWNNLGRDGRLLYSILAIDWPYGSSSDLFNYVDSILGIDSRVTAGDLP